MNSKENTITIPEKAKANLELDVKALQQFCVKYHIVELSLFGSILRDDFSDKSDVDMIVRFDQDFSVTLFDMVGIEEELSTIIGRPVDLVTRYSVETSENYIRRKHVLETEEKIYAA